MKMASPRAQEIRREWARSNRDLHNKIPSRASTTAAKMYPSLTDPLTQKLVKSNWEAERKRPSKKFKRRPFKKRGMRGDEENP
jgi:hypothetical protein